ncbi:hypothetical protein V3C99_003648 [Haemonchus contortus]|nr:C2 calcium-dependent membrane targeting domain containing protein [Haemonchus contortus]
MKDDGYMAVVCAILFGNDEDEKGKGLRLQLLEHLQEIYPHIASKHGQLLSQCLQLVRYQLEVIAHLPSTQTMVLYIFNEETCRQFVANTEETYTFDVGCHTNYKLKFSIARFSGEKRKAVVRSGSFLKRVMSLDRKEDESVALSQLPINNFVKKSVFFKGYQYNVDLRMLKNNDNDSMPHLDFEDLLDLTRSLYEHDAEGAKCYFSGALSDGSFSLLHCTSKFFHISPEVLRIVTLSIFLVWDTSKASLEDVAIIRLIKKLKSKKDIVRTDMLESALEHLAECVVAELRDVLQQFSHESLFPPDGYYILKRMNIALKVVTDICMLPIWDLYETHDPSSALTEQLVHMVTHCVEEWMQQELKVEVKDLKEEWMTVQKMWEMMQRNYQSYNLFFHQFNINYVDLALKTIDEKLESFSRKYLSERLAQLDSRQAEQLEKFTKCTMRFYDTLNSLADFGQNNGVKNLRLYEFETWFLDVTVFWTHSWRDISLRMVSRTISLDNDGDGTKYEQRRPLPAGLYSFLCIQKGLSDDYSMLAFKRPENIVMGSISLVHIYSENIYAYAKKLHNDALTNDSDKESRVIRAANGIEQALLFVSERWRRFVDFDRMAATVPAEEIVVIEKSCEEVFESSRRRCEQIIDGLLRIYCRSKRDDVSRIARNITLESYEHNKKLAVYMREVTPIEKMHANLDSVERMAGDVRADLLPRCSQMAYCILHKMLESEILRYLRKFQNPDYYTEIYVSLKAICSILEIPPQISQVASLVHMHSFTTTELILSYYARISEDLESSNSQSASRISMQVGYIPTTGDNVLVIIKVLGLENVPALNTLCDRVDPYVRLELLPACLYPPHCFPVQKTRTLTQCENLKWNQDFQFLVPQQLFYTHGSSLCISVLDHDRICDELIGRAFLSTNLLERIDCLSVKKLPPPHALRLSQPSVGHRLPFYKMLKERSQRDDIAKAFISQEKTAKKMYFKCLSRRFSTGFKSFKKHSI